MDDKGCYLGGGGSLGMPDPWKHTQRNSRKRHPSERMQPLSSEPECGGAVAASQPLTSALPGDIPSSGVTCGESRENGCVFSNEDSGALSYHTGQSFFFLYPS